ncbi:MAG: polyprenyl synthetase family protein [Alphaproteobacteria bacterium]|nr:polyprenyl synthetase family protein [Alphaproteobacteria bacterium]
MSHKAASHASCIPKIDEVNALEALHNFVKDDLNLVDKVIIREMTSQVPLIRDLAGYLIHAGGKRLRPMLTIACAQLAGYQGQRHIPLAACVEFIHTATLLHDDVIDESNLRRGIASANALWGNKASVLVGDFLFSRAFELIVADGSFEVLKILSEASSTIVEGEVLQLLTANNTATTETGYFNVIKAKTAQLFEAACHIGGVMAECTAYQKQALAAFGHNLGIVFQLIDDGLDYYGTESQLGKTPGDDFREGKVTLPVILAFTQGNADEKKFWERTLGQLDQTDQDLNLAIQYLKKYNVFSRIIEKAKSFSKRAKESLMVFPESSLRKLLLNVADFCVYRLS